MAVRANYRFSPDPKLSFLPKSFHPSLHFAKNLFSLAKPYPSAPLKSNQRNRHFQTGSFNTRDSYGIQRLAHSKCFRCGDIGHLVKNYCVPVRCYCFGGAGHKSFHCLKKPSSRSKISFESATVCDDSCDLMRVMGLDFMEVIDKMLLDPDVEACVKGISDPIFKLVVGSNASKLEGLALSDLDKNTILGDASSMKIPGSNWGQETDSQWSYPMTEPYSQGMLEDFSSPNFFTPPLSVGCPLHLDLSPVPFSLILGIIIDNEFVDYYSDKEEVSDSPLTHLAKNLGSNETPRSSGKELWAHMDQQKFIFYCRFQAVDGFARLERAHARGSNSLSPFRPKSTKEIDEASLQVL